MLLPNTMVDTSLFDRGRFSVSSSADNIVNETPAQLPAQPEAIVPDKEVIVVTAKSHPRANDPLKALNAESFAVTQSIDKAITGPVAMAYQHKIPSPIRSGLRNFLGNLHEPVVFLNYLLQIKPGKAGETFGRFALNSTLGAAGIFDVAKRRPFYLPRRPNGFADTLGFYGVKPGPFLFLPLIGPTTVRDLIGNNIDRLVLPLGVGEQFSQVSYTLPAGVIGSLDRRAEFDEKLQQLRQDKTRAYTALRNYYLLRRQDEIDALHGRHRLSSPKL